MAVRVVRYAQVASTPWKNGLGVTRQLAIHPQHAGAAAFEWRLSIAELTHSAAFSTFPNIERCLVVLEGSMTLQRAGTAALELSPQSAPLCFSGEVAACGVVEQGPVLDLNLMWQPALWQANVVRIEASCELARLRRTEVLMLCSLAAELPLQLAQSRLTLGRYDTLLIDAIDGPAIEGPLDALPGVDFAAYGIELQRR